MKNCFVVFLLCTIPFLSNGQKLSFRTDGYYYYDNKVDTLYLLKIADKNNKELIGAVQKAGFNIYNKGTDCVPKNTIPYDGSSYIQVFSFFSNVLGTHWTGNCWNKSQFNDAIHKIKLRKSGIKDKYYNDQKLQIKLFKNNFFVIDAGLNEHTIKRITGKLYKDKLVVNVTYPGLPKPMEAQMLEKVPREYYFYPFDKTPPTRDRFVYIYKNPKGN